MADLADNEVGVLLLPTTSTHITNHHTDTRRWDSLTLREGDVLIGTYPKSGTTWMQQIVRSLLGAPSDVRVDLLSPWVDMRISPLDAMLERLKAQTGRRFMKHHTALPHLPAASHSCASHIFVCRDGRDVVMSLHNFHRNFTPEYIAELKCGEFDGPPLEIAEEDAVAYFAGWLRGDGAPFWPFWSHIRSYWEVRQDPRVLLVHYSALKRDPEGEIARIYRFLSKFGPVREGDAETVVADAVKAASFDDMRRTADVTAPRGGVFLKNGGKTFFNKGSTARWKGVLPDDLIREYEETALRELGEECAHWLATGMYLEEKRVTS